MIPVGASGGAAQIAWQGITGGEWIVEPHQIYDSVGFAALGDQGRCVPAAVDRLKWILDST